MRTVRRESLKLNRAKFDALERIACAFASDKQTHLDFYQDEHRFSLLILDRAPINEKLSLAVWERRQVQNYLCLPLPVLTRRGIPDSEHSICEIERSELDLLAQ
jgi:hypothetical protein